VLEDFASAIERDDSTFIKSLLENREIDANARLPRPYHPPALVHAVRHKRTEIVDMLLKAGARIDAVDDVEQSACRVANFCGRIDVLRVLLVHALRERCKGHDWSFLPSRSSKCNSDCNLPFDVLLRLIRAGAPLDDVDRAELCRLATTSTSAIQVLMDRGVLVSKLCDDYNQTPLHIATDPDVLRVLVDVCGVDLEARDSEWESCTGIAVDARRVDALRLFLLAGADVNDTESDFDPLLNKSVMSTSDYGDITCTLLLLAAGADVTARDRQGRTALICAAEWAHQSMRLVHAMLAAGADLDAEDDSGRTPRQWLAESDVAVDPEQVEAARREIAKVRLDFVRQRALQVCIGLQSRGLDALQTCEVLVHACGPLAQLIKFHQWWTIVTTVKHFKQA
jgi:ankyrin repeat protein